MNLQHYRDEGALKPDSSNKQHLRNDHCLKRKPCLASEAGLAFAQMLA